MRSAVLIVGSVFAIAAIVSFWPAAPPPVPLVPNAAAPSPPAPLAVAHPAEPPVVRPAQAVRVQADPAPSLEVGDAAAPEADARIADVDDEDSSEQAPPDAPLLPSRTLAIDMPPGTSPDEPLGPASGAVARAFATAGRQISGALRTAGSVVRAAF